MSLFAVIVVYKASNALTRLNFTDRSRAQACYDKIANASDVASVYDDFGHLWGGERGNIAAVELADIVGEFKVMIANEKIKQESVREAQQSHIIPAQANLI